MLRRTSRVYGFTLIEMMIVVAIIGLLTSIALPAFRIYLRRSKTSEALLNIRRLFDSTVTYIESEHADHTGTTLPRIFPAGVSWNPAHGVCCSLPGHKCLPEIVFWTDATWQALNFSLDDPFYYSYQTVNAVGDGSKADDLYQVEASGDLNCDRTYSLFRRSIRIGNGFPITGGSGIYAQHEPD